MKKYDYVVVGAGAAGCVLAYRLSADPAVSVALLEAGGPDTNPFIHMPKGLAKAMSDPALLWAYSAEPEKGNAFQPEYWVRGRVLGGSSSVNGMMYVRGMPADFDEIAAVSSEDWSWRRIGAAYSALEAPLDDAPRAPRAAGGPLHLSKADRRTALTDAMVEAGTSMGLPRKEDTNAPDSGDGIGYSTRTIWRGRRQSAATAFLDPIRRRPNLTILTHALVDKVNFEGRRAVSVSIAAAKDRPAESVGANRDIILAGGAMASPGILQRSGVGPAALLAELGIPLVQDSPQVGQHLLEHRGIIMQWKLKVALSDNSQYSGWRLPLNVARYYLIKNGPMSSAAYEIGAWFRSRPGVPRPDIQFLVTPFSFDFSAQRTKLETFPGMSIVAYPLRPTSRGEINIKSRDPNVLPVLKPHYYTDPADRALMIETVKVARRYADQAALRRFIEVETYPGAQCQGDDEIIDAYDRQGSCGYHAVGSCRMGSDPAAVVDPALRVRGVEGLRVMDTSIMPQIPSGNTNGPTMAMAWRAADVITRAR